MSAVHNHINEEFPRTSRAIAELGAYKVNDMLTPDDLAGMSFYESAIALEKHLEGSLFDE